VEVEYRENETVEEFSSRVYAMELRQARLDRLGGYGMYSGSNDLALMLTISFALVFKLFELWISAYITLFNIGLVI
jgi:hypothetical protein